MKLKGFLAYTAVLLLLLAILPTAAGQQDATQTAATATLARAYYVDGTAGTADMFAGDAQLPLTEGMTLQTGVGNTQVAATVRLANADTAATHGVYRLAGFNIGSVFSDTLESTVAITGEILANAGTNPVTAVYVPQTAGDLASTEVSEAPISAVLLQDYYPNYTPADSVAVAPTDGVLVSSVLTATPSGQIPIHTSLTVSSHSMSTQTINDAFYALADNVGFTGEVDLSPPVRYTIDGNFTNVSGSVTLAGTTYKLGEIVSVNNDKYIISEILSDRAAFVHCGTKQVYRMNEAGELTSDEGTGYDLLSFLNQVILVDGVEYTVGVELVSFSGGSRQLLYDAEGNCVGYSDTAGGEGTAFSFIADREPTSQATQQAPLTQISFFDADELADIPSNASYKIHDYSSVTVGVSQPVSNTPAVLEYQAVNGSVPHREDNRYIGMISTSNPLTGDPLTFFDDVTTAAAAQLSQMGASATASLKALVAGTYEIDEALGAVHRAPRKTFGSNLQTARSTSALSTMLLSGTPIPVGIVCFEPASEIARPVISPDGGTFTEAQQVTITCATQGAELYYTLDGSDPSRNSTKYTAPFTLSESATVKAVAVKNTLESKQVASAAFTINITAPSPSPDAPIAVATPVISPAAGRYYDSVEVTLSCTTLGANLFYTTDGSTPTALSLPYGGVIRLSESATVKAIAIKDGMTDSAVASADFVIRSDGSNTTSTSRQTGTGGIKSYTISFETNGGSSVDSQKVGYGKTVAKPADPVKSGYTFSGWYTDAMLTQPYDFSTAVGESFILYARWLKSDWVNPFTDVSPDDWFYEPVRFAVENGLVNGVTSSSFAPNSYITRAMLVTILYRAEGQPAVSGDSGFDDVPPGAYYEKAVTWAQQNGIVTGYSATAFGPDDNILREQIAAIMYRYAAYKGYDTSAAADLTAYTDANAIAEYAVSAMQYAVGSGLMQGKTESTLNPKDFATRAEIVTILKRFIEANA